MNIYVVTEGTAEKKTYTKWIPEVNKSLKLISSIDDVGDNNYYVFSARGYPEIFNSIENAIEDIGNYPEFNRLVIAVDSDELTRKEKYVEISEFLRGKGGGLDIRIIVQHFCFETWALGNQRIIRRQSINPKLREYRILFDVRVKDPELLPARPEEEYTRSQFAEKYLRLVLNDRFRALSYSKGNPYPVTEAYYFYEIKKRYEMTAHIDSFSSFLSAFV